MFKDIFNKQKLAAAEARIQVLSEWVESNVKATTNQFMAYDKLAEIVDRLTAKVEPTTIKVHDITAIDLAYQIRKECKIEQKSAGIGGKEFYQVPVSFIHGIILAAKDIVDDSNGVK